MKRVFYILTLLLLCSATCLWAESKTLFSSLNPSSLSQALAFYELYPDTEEGKAALKRINQLLKKGDNFFSSSEAHLLYHSISGTLSDEEIQIIERLSSHFPNRLLKGYKAQSEQEVLALPSEEVDLGRALLLSQLDGKPDMLEQTRLYSAKLDLIALQILAALPEEATPEEKIAVANQFIFEEMHFRFPPHSLYAKDIDHYTFLPSVMDNHLGVCLGVSALYLAVAQRIGLPFETITPPGHIFLSYKEGDKVINIETTARGINTPSDRYLGVNTRTLKKRTCKEVIGMTHFNQAGLYMHAERYAEAVKAMEKARLYMPRDPLVIELLGYSYLLMGEKERGEELLREIKDVVPEECVIKENLVNDYLEGKCDPAAIAAVFMQVDEKRESILEKQERLKEVVARFPYFRAGVHQLAVTYLQLHRFREALKMLSHYHELDPHDPTVEYYLSMLYAERRDYPSAWRHLKNAERITAEKEYAPKALHDLRKTLIMVCPEEF